MKDTDFKTSDISLASFLRAKGWIMKGAGFNFDRLEFVFDIEAQKIADTWDRKPTKRMQFIKDLILERETLFRILKEERKARNYGPNTGF